MTKSIKKIFAALLVVATLALMIPFSASAARDASTNVTFKLSDPTVLGKFKFDIYKLAEIKTSTGAVTTVTGLPADVKTAVEAKGTDVNTKALIAACKSNLANLGTAVKTWDATTASVTYRDLGAGIYYVHPVAKGVSTKANDSIVVLPKYDDATKKWVEAGTIDLASKVSTSTIVLDKKITGVDDTATENDKYATAGLGSTVEFELSANVPGSKDAKLRKYDILDQMEPGLTFEKGSVTVAYEDGTPIDSSKYEVVSPYTFEIDEKTYTYTFGVKFIPSASTGYVEDIYNDKKIVVKFKATVNKDATVGKDSNDNTVSLHYANDDTEKIQGGPKVQVFAFNLQVVKEDNGGQKLAGATFYLFKKDKTTKIATATSDDNGLVQFTKDGKQIQLAKGTYWVQETEAPEGYVLPTGDAAWTKIEVTPTFAEDGSNYKLTSLTNAGDTTLGFATMTVKNTKITVPKTGGMGTTLFTICGASLIVLAGVMFVVLKKKKTSK